MTYGAVARLPGLAGGELSLMLTFGAMPVSAAQTAGEWTVPEAPSEVLPVQPDGGLVHLLSHYRLPPRLGALLLRKKRVIAPDDVMIDYADRGGANGDPWLDMSARSAAGSRASSTGIK